MFWEIPKSRGLLQSGVRSRDTLSGHNCRFFFDSALQSLVQILYNPQIRSSLASTGLPTAAIDSIVSGAKTCYVDTANAKDASDTPASCKALTAAPTLPKASPVQLSPAQQKVYEDAQAKVASTVKDTLTDAVKQANAKNFISAFGVALIFELFRLGIVFILSFLLPRHINPAAMQEGH